MIQKGKNARLRFTDEDLEEKGFRQTVLRKSAANEPVLYMAGRKRVFDQKSGKTAMQRLRRQSRFTAAADAIQNAEEISQAESDTEDGNVTDETLQFGGESAWLASLQLKKWAYSRKLKERAEEKTRKSKWIQKKKIRESYCAAKRGQAEDLKDSLICALRGEIPISRKKGRKRAVQTFIRRKKSYRLFLILLAVFAIMVLLSFGMVIIGLSLPVNNGTIVTTSYTANDRDIVGANADYTALERALQQKISRIEAEHQGYDEYRYDMAEIGHDPFQLTAFLTVKKEAYTRQEVQALLQELFAHEYILTLQEKTETRSRVKRDEDGNILYNDDGSEQTETYDWHVLIIRLQNRGIDGAVSEEGLDSEEQSRYEILTETRGNREYLFGEDVYVPDNTADTGDAGYEVPGEALTDGEFSRLYEEASRYLGMEYVWGGSSPETGFDCSGFVCWSINHSGYGHVGRTTANGLLAKCTRIGSGQAQPGDLIFFQGTYATKGASHVGIYIGGGRMIHCGNPIKISNVSTAYWNSRYLTYGRLKDAYR